MIKTTKKKVARPTKRTKVKRWTGPRKAAAKKSGKSVRVGPKKR
jgi:hypothetical protein